MHSKRAPQVKEPFSLFSIQVTIHLKPVTNVDSFPFHAKRQFRSAGACLNVWHTFVASSASLASAL